MWSPDAAVLDANLAFYEAFASQSFEAMSDVWATEAPIVCIHPGWQPIFGRERVMASWRAVLAGEPTNIRCEGPQTTVRDQVGIVTCIEHIVEGRLAATNIFVLEDGLWKMIHHQAAPFAERHLPSEVVPPPESLN